MKNIHIISIYDVWKVKNEVTGEDVWFAKYRFQAIRFAKRFKKIGYKIIVHNYDGSVNKII